jgi:hypothetical protein
MKPHCLFAATFASLAEDAQDRQLLATEAKRDRPRLEHEADLNARPDCLASAQECRLDHLCLAGLSGIAGRSGPDPQCW